MRTLLRYLTFTAILLVFTLAVTGVNSSLAGSIAGKVTYKGRQRGAIYVRAYPVPKGLRRHRYIWEHEPLITFSSVRTHSLGPYTISDLPDSNYTLWAWMDINGNGEVDYDIPEPTGWYTADNGSLDEVTINEDSQVQNINIILKRPTPFPTEDKRIEHGSLRTIKDKKVLHLWGKPAERGYAQGFLVGPQIRDMIEFFNVEFVARSASYYEKSVIPFVESRSVFTEEDNEELDAMLKGMRDSGSNMFIDALGREVIRGDLYALNAYGEWWGEDLSCSSVSAWGKATENDELKDGLIIGRDMDGEIDLRKTTIISVLIFAVEPASPKKKKWVSVMWPGFIGTYSGMNEEGVGIFDHSGNGKSDPAIAGYRPGTLIMRDVLETVGAKNTVSEAEKAMMTFRGPKGGPFNSGEILFIVSPYVGQKVPAAIYEVDMEGGVMRYPDEARPTCSYNLVCTNTYLKYRVSPNHAVRFCRRYADLADRLVAFKVYGKSIGTPEIIELIQVSGNRTTEHSIIFRPNQMTIDLAYENLVYDIREAALCEWTSYRWEELFE
ncbi:hypothetical protein ISS37_01010 [candidate division KSB1 bacterium]|nr:hypothetical protein [candidate division KSB1 bacterium]